MTTAQQPVKATNNLMLNNGSVAMPLKTGLANVVKAKAGEHYRITNRKEGKDQLQDNVIVKRVGDDLQLQYADGTQLILSNFYGVSTGDAICDLTLPGKDGKDYKVSEKQSSGTDLGDGITLVYAHGDHDVLMAMATGDKALNSTLAGISGTELTYTPSASIMESIAGINPWWVAGGVAVVGAGVGIGAGMGGGSNEAAVVVAPTRAPVADTTAPVLQSIASQGSQVVLTYNEALNATHLPLNTGFVVLVNGVANTVTTVSVSGSTMTLTLTTAIVSGASVLVNYIAPTVDNSANNAAIQDLAGNDAANINTGVVADGYIRGAQISIDTGHGIVTLPGVFTDAKGMFILPANAPAGIIRATGGTNIDTGIANTLELKAPAGSSVINPLTSMVQAYIDANPTATTEVASARVVQALGLSADTDLTKYDPIAALAVNSGDTAALAIQKAAVQIAIIITLASAAPTGVSSDTAATNALKNLVAQIGTVSSPNVIDLTSTQAITAALGSTSSASVQNIQSAFESIRTATTVDDIATIQKDIFKPNAPSAPVVSLADDTGDSNSDHITSNGRVNVTGTKQDATIQYSIDGGVTWNSSFSAINGLNTVEVKQIVSGVASISTVLSFTKDTTAPSAAVFDIVASDDIINSVERAAGVTVTGSTEAGSTVAINGHAAKVNGTTWSYSLDSQSIQNGDNTLTAITKDLAGNTTSSTHTFTLDTTAPAVNVTQNAPSNNIHPIVSGTAEAGVNVSVVIAGATYSTIATNGVWSINTATATPASGTLALNVSGTNNVSVTATDAAGNNSSATASFIIDTAATIDVIAIDNIINSDEQAAGVIITGTKEAGRTVTLTVSSSDATLKGTETISIDATHWSYALSSKAINALGQNEITVTATTNNSSAPVTKRFDIDTIAPDAPIILAIKALDFDGELNFDSGFTVNEGSDVTVTVENDGDFFELLDADALAAYFTVTTLEGIDSYRGKATKFFGTEVITVTATLTDEVGNVSSADSIGLAPIYAILSTLPGAIGYDAGFIVSEGAIVTVTIDDVELDEEQLAANFTFSNDPDTGIDTYRANAGMFFGSEVITVAATLDDAPDASFNLAPIYAILSALPGAIGFDAGFIVIEGAIVTVTVDDVELDEEQLATYFTVTTIEGIDTYRANAGMLFGEEVIMVAATLDDAPESSFTLAPIYAILSTLPGAIGFDAGFIVSEGAIVTVTVDDVELDEESLTAYFTVTTLEGIDTYRANAGMLFGEEVITVAATLDDAPEASFTLAPIYSILSTLSGAIGFDAGFIVSEGAVVTVTVDDGELDEESLTTYFTVTTLEGIDTYRANAGMLAYSD